MLWAVWFADALVLALVLWWNRNHRLMSGTPWWSPQPRARGISDTRYGIILSLVLLVATVLRCVALNSDLWIDEVLMLDRFVRHDLGTVISDFRDDNQHILYSVLAHIGINIFGESAAVVRLPAMLFGVGSIWASAHLVRYVFGKTEALYTAALLALSYHHVWFSQNARAYTMLVFGAVVSTELLLRALASGNRRYWFAYSVVLALTAWAHLTVVFVAAAHAMVLLAMGLNHLRRARSGYWQWQPFLALGLAAWITINLYAPALLQMYAHFSLPNAGSTPGPVAWSNPFWLVNEVLRQLDVSLALGWLGLILFALLGLSGLIYVFRRDWLFSALALGPVLLTAFVLMVLGRSLWPRMFFQEIGFFSAIASVGALGAGELLTRVVRIAPVLVRNLPAMLLCMMLAISLPKVYQLPKQDFSGARDFVIDHLQPGDTVFGIHMAGAVYNRYYRHDWPRVDTLKSFNEHEARNGYTWVLYTLPAYIKSSKPRIQHKLDAEYDIMRKFPGTLGDGEVIVARSKQRGGRH